MAHNWDPPLFSLAEEEKLVDPLLSQLHEQRTCLRRTGYNRRKPVTVDNPPKGEGWQLQDIVLIVDGEHRASKAWFKDGAISDFLEQSEDPEVRKQTLFLPNNPLLFETASAPFDAEESISSYEYTADQPSASITEGTLDYFELEQPFMPEETNLKPADDQDHDEPREQYNYSHSSASYEYIYPYETCQNKLNPQLHWEKRYICHICGENCKNNVFLERHILDHSKPLAFSCRYPRCSKSFNSKVALVAHYQAHSQEQKFSCDFCGRHFTNSCHVKSHMRKIHPETDWLYPDSEVKQLFRNSSRSGHRRSFL